MHFSSSMMFAGVNTKLSFAVMLSSLTTNEFNTLKKFLLWITSVLDCLDFDFILYLML